MLSNTQSLARCQSSLHLHSNRVINIRPHVFPSYTHIQIRFGGGGGRPGGRPSYNYKERRVLGIDEPYKKLKLRPWGFMEDIEHLIKLDEKAGDFEVDFAKTVNFKEPAFDYARTSNRKRVDPASLFGSNKGYGMIATPPKKQNFSHKRIFGEKLKRTKKADTEL